MEDEFEYSQSGKAAQDLFVSEHATHIFYVEDSGSEIFFERLFKKLFPKLEDFEIVCLHGKTNVRNKTSESRIDNLTYVFVVDKDFDDLLGAPIPGVTYLDRYSIENYLADFGAIVNVLVEEYPNGLTAQEVKAKCSDSDGFIGKLHARLIEITGYFVVARRRWLDIKTTKFDVQELNEGSNEWHPMPTSEWMVAYRSKVLKESGLTDGDLDFELANAFEPCPDFPDPTLIPLHHVAGKHLLQNLLKYLCVRTVEEFESRLGKSLYIRILNHIKLSEFSIFKERLMSHHSNLIALQ